MRIKNFICCAGILLAFATACFAGDKPVAVTKPRMVNIGTMTYSGISRITLTADRKILLTHEEGVAGFAVEQVPKHFLEAWGFTDIALEMGFALAAEDAQSDPLPAPTPNPTPQESPRKVETTAPPTGTRPPTTPKPAVQQQNASQNTIQRLVPSGGNMQLQSQPQALPQQQPQQQFNNNARPQLPSTNGANPATRFGSGRRTRPSNP
jgi:hypothetical protein